MILEVSISTQEFVCKFPEERSSSDCVRKCLVLSGLVKLPSRPRKHFHGGGRVLDSVRAYAIGWMGHVSCCEAYGPWMSGTGEGAEFQTSGTVHPFFPLVPKALCCSCTSGIFIKQQVPRLTHVVCNRH